MTIPNMRVLMEQPAQPTDKEHLRLCFAKAGLSKGEDLRRLLERLPLAITRLSDGDSFPIFALEIAGKSFRPVRLKHTELICLLGMWREAMDRLELLPGQEQAAFLGALDVQRLKGAVLAAKATSRAIRSIAAGVAG